MAIIISADEIKKTLPGYDPSRSEEFHEQSARLADTAFANAIKNESPSNVVLMSGGTASGKSEYVSVYLEGARAIVLDGTLPTIEGARIKIRRARKCDKSIRVVAVMPESLTVAFGAFLFRERKFSVEHFYRTHSASRRTLFDIAHEFPDIPITIIESAYEADGSMSFTELVFMNREKMIELLGRRQYTEEQIRNIVFHHAT